MPTSQSFGVPLLCAAVGAQGPAADDAQARFEWLRARLEQQRIEHHVRGMALAVVFADGRILTADFGLADAENDRPVGPDTVFSIGSATKSFTAVLAAMVAADGKLDFDDHVQKHLPWFRLHDAAASAEVTLRDLLCHRTGLARTDALLDGTTLTEEDVARQLAHAEPVSPFRKRFRYNNQLYLVAGMTTAAAAGKDWHELLRTRLLEPLGMQNTTSRLADTDRKRLASGYAWNAVSGTWTRLPTHGIDLCAPCGSLYSTAADMARWLRFLLQRGKLAEHALLPRTGIEGLWRTQIATSPGTDEAYGLGFMLSTRHGSQLVHHGGNLDGFTTQVMLLPDAGIGFVLLMNAQFTALQGDCQETVFSWLLDPPYAFADADEQRQLPGLYRHEKAQLDWRVVVGKNGKLAIDVPGQQIYELLPPDAEGKRYFALTNAIAVRFDREEQAATATSMTVFQAGQEIRMPRQGPLAQAPAAPTAMELATLQRFTGRFRLPKPSPNGLQEVTALIEKGKLALDVPGQRIYELKPPNAAGRWVFALTDSIEIAFESNAAGEVEGLTMFQAGMEFRFRRVEADPDLPTRQGLLDLLAKAVPHSAGFADQVVRVRGRISMPNQGLSGTFDWVALGGRRLAMITDFGKFGSTRVVIDGERGWRHSQRTGRVELTAEEIATQRQGLPLLGANDAAVRLGNLTALRRERDGDRHVIVARGDTAPTTLYIDAETGDILRRDVAITLGNMGSLLVTVTSRDFRVVAGARVAHRLRSESQASGRTELELETIEVGGELPESAFEAPKPAAPK